MTDRQYYAIKGYLSDYLNFDKITYDLIMTFAKIRRLAKKHHRLAEYDCNGEGYVKGKFWRLDDEKAFSNIGTPEEKTIFTVESDKIEAKIQELAESIGLKADFQGDPRGATVILKTSRNQEIYPTIDL